MSVVFEDRWARTPHRKDCGCYFHRPDQLKPETLCACGHAYQGHTSMGNTCRMATHPTRSCGCTGFTTEITIKCPNMVV